MRVGVEHRFAEGHAGRERAGRIQAQSGYLGHLARQREAVRMQARRSQPEHDVTRRDPARQDLIALHRADRKAREIVVAALVEPGHLGGLAADQRAARLAAACGDPFHDLRADFGRELAAGEIVEKEQRLGALHDEIVHRHRDEIDPDRLVPAGLDRDHHLGADAVGSGDQNRVLETGALEVEQPAEAADFGVSARPRGRAHQRLDQLDHAVAGVDIDARLRVSKAVALSFMRFGLRGK